MIFLFRTFFFFLYLSFVFLFLYLFFVGGFLFEIFLFCLGGVDVTLTFVFDFVSLGFFSCVSFISAIVFYYRVFYIEGSLDERRFS
jgi:NADH:ubiquinone oxidoreductase subunit 5 (subunit L)/multisubunit Na+/H+ antiporter MnhA subunit